MPRSPLRRLLLSLALFLTACAGGGPESSDPDGPAADGPWTQGAHLQAEAQDRGDPEEGRRLLLNGPFMTCGIPWKVWENPAFIGTDPAVAEAGVVHSLDHVEWYDASFYGRITEMVYDTTYWSQSNAGHVFGDHSTPDERRAVIEYLKTL